MIDTESAKQGFDAEAYNRRWAALKQERQSFFTHWQEISDNILPRAGRYFVQDRNKGDRTNKKIYDNTATRALNVLASGMMSGATSPARPWFRLATADADLMEFGPVKIWLEQVSTLMRNVFQRSNTYRSLHMIYEELGAFGTAASFVVQDWRDVIRHYPLTAGEYAVALDHRGNVATLYREFEMTVESLIGKFGRDNCSNTVKSLYDRGQYDQWITVIHAVEPNHSRDLKKRDNGNMPWHSCYFEAGGDRDKPLSRSGFKRFPALVPRWTVSGGDIYGQSPAMEALGDVKQLQHQQLRKAQCIDYQTKPPLQVPAAMKARDIDILPGGITYVDAIGAQNAIAPMYQVNLNLQHLLLDMQDVRQRINSAFFSDLFLMLANDTRSGITATEVAERHEEKLLMLGPVLERLHNEMLDPLVDIAFDHIVDAGLLPPPPQEMQGMGLDVQYVSVLAQAQQAVGTGAIDRLLGVVGSVAQIKPGVLDKLDGDQLIDVYSNLLGVDPSLILADDKVAIVRQQRAQVEAQAQQSMQMQQMMQMAPDAVKTLADTDTSGKNALTDVMRMAQR